jgi:hypothetical protein
MGAFLTLRKSVQNAREPFYAPRAEREITGSESSKAQFFV